MLSRMKCKSQASLLHTEMYCISVEMLCVFKLTNVKLLVVLSKVMLMNLPVT